MSEAVEDIITIALIGIYTLLLISLTFNFVLAVTLRGVKGKVDEVEKRSLAEAEVMEARLNKIKEEILHRKGLVV